MGISQADQQDMFKMFSNPRTENYQKTSIGLGLSYSKAVISKLNGSIYCESQPDEGTKFNFDIIAKRSSNDRGLTQSEEL